MQALAAAWRLVIAALAPLVVGTGPAMAQEGISGAEAIDATKQLLRRRGFAPPADSRLSYKDYIHVQSDPDGDMTRVLLRIDAKGRLMPTRTWQNMHSSYCRMQSRSVRKAKRILRFKLVRWREQADGKVREQTTVFAGILDADTNIIKEQREADGTQLWSTRENVVGASLGNLSPDHVATVMARAWDDLRFTGRGMVGPCGAKQPEDDGPIQPRDGQWRINLVSQSAQGCPARIARGIKTALGGMFTAGKVHSLDFDEPFHPEPLLGQGPPVDWQRSGMNSWHAVMNRTGNGSGSIVVTVDAEVLSPTLISERQVVDIDMGDFFSCSSIADFELNWVAATAPPAPPDD